MGHRHAWTDEDIGVALDDRLSMAEKMDIIGVSAQAIRTARHRANNGMRIGGGVGLNDDPSKPGSRTVLAKTCTLCGLFLDARCYTKQVVRGKLFLFPYCKWCSNERKRSGERVRGVNHQWDQLKLKQLQDASIETATRHRQPFAKLDHDIGSDPSLTIFQKAIKARRTYRAMQTFCSKNRYRSLYKPLGDKSEGQWQIKFNPTPTG